MLLVSRSVNLSDVTYPTKTHGIADGRCLLKECNGLFVIAFLFKEPCHVIASCLASCIRTQLHRLGAEHTRMCNIHRIHMSTLLLWSADLARSTIGRETNYPLPSGNIRWHLPYCLDFRNSGPTNERVSYMQRRVISPLVRQQAIYGSFSLVVYAL